MSGADYYVVHRLPATVYKDTKSDLHTAVSHRHGVICQGVAGDLAVVGTGGGGETAARGHMVWVGRIAAPIRPGQTQRAR